MGSQETKMTHEQRFINNTSEIKKLVDLINYDILRSEISMAINNQMDKIKCENAKWFINRFSFQFFVDLHSFYRNIISIIDKHWKLALEENISTNKIIDLNEKIRNLRSYVEKINDQYIVAVSDAITKVPTDITIDYAFCQ